MGEQGKWMSKKSLESWAFGTSKDGFKASYGSIPYHPPHYVGAWLPNEFVMILVKTVLLVGGSIPPLTYTDYIMVSNHHLTPLGSWVKLFSF